MYTTGTWACPHPGVGAQATPEYGHASAPGAHLPRSRQAPCRAADRPPLRRVGMRKPPHHQSWHEGVPPPGVGALAMREVVSDFLRCHKTQYYLVLPPT